MSQKFSIKNYLIAPSILSADFARLGEETAAVLEAGGDIVHFDVMDNHYVPNLSMGAMFCKALRNYGITAPIDVHLMTTPVDNLVVSFAEAGANNISFHPDATVHVNRTIKLIHEYQCTAGIVLNPATPLCCLDYILDSIDLILIMTVNPGFGGQSFIDSTLQKITSVRKLIDYSGRNIRLQVDGGINVDNIGLVASAGADTFVAGSAIFNAPNYQQVIQCMRDKLTNVTIEPIV